MKKVVLLCLVLLTCVQVFAQSVSDTIEVKKGFSTVFRQNGRNLTPKQLLDITQSNPEAYKEMKIAKGKAGVANVLGYAGGFLVGWPIGAAIGGGEPNWALAGIGAGLIGVAIPFATSFSKHTQNAARIYNSGLTQTGMNHFDLKLGFTGNGLGLNLKF
ncbi:hypothetical protein [Sabulibacter ruber]|uniref:hypothetical protein n=1 Tax=Sabulibacter ruber TaxID=2811901 RepID=UPI001A970938|nr:hypothetical protein [Sabulibacter ruber]